MLNIFQSKPLPSSPNQSPKECIKELHKNTYKMIKDAITLDEQTESGNKNKVIELYKRGLKSLNDALAIKFIETDLDSNAKKLIQKMRGNRDLVVNRLSQLEEEQQKNCESLKIKTKLTKTTNKFSNLNVNPKVNNNQHNRNLIRNSINKGDNVKNCLPNSESNRTIASPIHSSSNFKGIDKKLVEIILDNVYVPPNSNLTFDSISGLHNAKKVLKESVLWPMLNKELFTGLRQPSRGVLFFGPPGCGKTLLAKAIASECKANFLSITASSLTSKWLGESEKLVKALFSVARQLKPCILFVDEIDSLLSQRKENESEATRRLKTEMFCELDGLRSDENDQLFVLAATNTPFSLDQAALRRFPKRIFIDLPCLREREELFIKLLSQDSKNPLTNNEINKLAVLTEGYSASDIHALCKDAALQPLREIQSEDKIKNLNPNNIRRIKIDDFLSSLKKIRKSVDNDSVERLKEWSSIYGDNC